MGDKLKKKWAIEVIQHSHTDIGYTDRQEKIGRYHADFILQALNIIDQAEQGKTEWQDFRWNCETFWQIERFIEHASAGDIKRFIHAVQVGKIEITGNYLNMTELIDGSILAKFLNRAQKYSTQIEVPVKSAMTADINGFSWGYAQALANAGIENLFTGIHTHHGMFPAGRKQMPFWWETEKGERILVWIGEGYHFGNDLGIVPDQVSSYYIKDNWKTNYRVEDQLELAKSRIFAYLANLEEEAYPFDFVPVHVCGTYLDNAPPNARICEFINSWNLMYGDTIHLEMTTVTPLFEKVRNSHMDIPTYRGDWPDWWSDGVASTASQTRLFRHAQRKLRNINSLQNLDGLPKLKEYVEQAEQNLMLYAEHTWGHASSVSAPWHEMVQALEFRKLTYASEAHRLASLAHDEVQALKGERLLSADRPFIFKIINPFDSRFSSIVQLNLENWEVPFIENGFVIKGITDSRNYPFQLMGQTIYVEIDLMAKEEALIVVEPKQALIGNPYGSYMLNGADNQVQDVKYLLDNDANANKEPLLSMTSLETEYVRIEWKVGEGIISWMDKKQNTELIHSDRKHNAFTPVYEITQNEKIKDAYTTRQQFGRNRKGATVERHVGSLVKAQSICEGPLLVKVELHYQLQGTEFYILELTAYRNSARVDAAIRLHKESIWYPENVYISLPFTAAEHKETLWIEKTGCVVRPQLDQLPGTLTDFYCIQEGLGLIGEHRTIGIAVSDAPLIQLGKLDYGLRSLSAANPTNPTFENLYSWVLNNYWETNFKATIGGFYEFKYTVFWGESDGTPQELMQKCFQFNSGLIAFRSS